MNHIPLPQVQAAFDYLAHQATDLGLLDPLSRLQVLHHRLWQG